MLEVSKEVKSQPNMVNKLIVSGILGISAIASIIVFATQTSANPLEFLVQNNGTSASASTSIAFMTAGAATSTSNVYDTYGNGNGNTYATNNLALEIQFSASSTASTLTWYYEFAQGGAGANCVNSPNSCDWYVDATFSNTSATTTPNISMAGFNQYQWKFASTSQAGAVVASTNNIANKIVTVPTSARYVRAVFGLLPGSTNGGVWAAFVGQKQASR